MQYLTYKGESYKRVYKRSHLKIPVNATYFYITEDIKE